MPLILTPTSELSREEHGGKALGLLRLLRADGRIPATLVVSADEDLGDGVAITDWLRESQAHDFVIRSSAPGEDGSGRSGAGQFLSLRVSGGGLVEAAARVRAQAATLGSGPAIPLLVQPVIDGPGGVYTSHPGRGFESLHLARSGPQAVTSGTALPPDLLFGDSPEAVMATSACRDIAGRLGGAVDFEFVVDDVGVVWLQFRPLVAPPTPPTAGLSEHFASPLPPLCGTIWLEVLRREYGDTITFEDGFLLGLADDEQAEAEPGGVAPTDQEIRDALDYYHRTLFPRWEAMAAKMAKSPSRTAAEWFTEAMDMWSSFWSDYLNNPHEEVVRAARVQAGRAAGLAPSVRKHMERLFDAGQGVGEAHFTWANAPESVRTYIAEYGYLPLGGNDFSQPTLAEMPEACFPQLRNARRPPEPVGEPSMIHLAAWLTEEDNFYKWRFGALLRASIANAAQELLGRGWLPSATAVWQVPVADFRAALFGLPTPFMPHRLGESRGSGTVLDREAPRLLFSATALSEGSAAGRVGAGSDRRPGDILVAMAIDASDYPALSVASGAIVALAGPDSHVSLFAREIGIPLVCSPEAVRVLRAGQMVEIKDKPATVRILAELAEPC